ncbi:MULTISPECIES: citrate synthase/methylcitrate synthase [Variovorax]|jgi:citrate synthase|uniref:citrate synthase/methylcitrate synthase n=1 Tax=Variovorax TaxID=34072 RepID=UPI00086D8D34|nr:MULTISPECIES: citrate synthase/methylcitrate synthase [Variovorax]MBN8754960.1 citrate synthase/methylcitrate synthase [Variovorax sp.]ODU14781.1 MAG: citrate synthase/methylcitrate synthase [Variovorax sp. SCN 67-85]ODV26115.1 MAG: citrate synthase/methylcitrate synthase [Variovorax sp. SCN 67-20]OJZ03624.1 MAG: citrate synthase/methylcitrate synthase [Variovorax sp. 67-131]UKI07324.1 citrate synthase/methylcitrate synthase [Variovorax paradoxus]
MNNDDGSLEGVVAARTVLSEVDGEAGRLVIRGHALDEIAQRWRYEDVVGLLFEGFFDTLPGTGTEALRIAIGRARREAFERLQPNDDAVLRRLPPIEAVRALLARLPDGDGLGDDLPTALRLVAAPAVYTAAVMRWRLGVQALAPDEALPHATDMLRMLHGRAPTPAQSAALDTYLVTVCDHGLNASTFAARVVASTGAGLASAVLAGISALKGPLHGGAPGPVLDALDAIGSAANARAWLEQAVTEGQRLMGFGHRIYRVRDPRADALKGALGRLGKEGSVNAARFALAEAAEQAALAILREKKPGRALETNVEFYTALLLEALGFGRESFTCVFAAGRVGGWVAHAREQVKKGRLIRPQSVYVGPAPEEAGEAALAH